MTKEKSAAQELQATTGCSYSTALAKVRYAEDLRRAQVRLSMENMIPLPLLLPGVTDPKDGEK